MSTEQKVLKVGDYAKIEIIDTLSQHYMSKLVCSYNGKGVFGFNDGSEFYLGEYFLPNHYTRFDFTKEESIKKESLTFSEKQIVKAQDLGLKRAEPIGELPNYEDVKPFDNHDNHYASQKFEPIDIIEQKVIEWTEAGVPPEVAYNLGQTLKYIFRAGLKDDLNKELDKALNYLTRAQTGEWRK